MAENWKCDYTLLDFWEKVKKGMMNNETVNTDANSSDSSITNEETMKQTSETVKEHKFFSQARIFFISWFTGTFFQI